MHVISRKKLRGFWKLHPEAEDYLRAWFRVARRETWSNFAEMKVSFPKADRVGKLTVFNIAGNRYRLIAAIHHNRGKVYIRHVLTHAEYDRLNLREE
jgi:mRNA interferase HigB